MKIKFPKRKKKFKKGGSGIKPDLYWMCILITGLVLMICSIAFGLYLFLKTGDELKFSAPDNINQEAVEQERINKALKYFIDREKKSAEILNSPVPIIDPTL